MDGGPATGRITELLAKADEAIEARDHAKAASVLRAASQLDAQHEEVRRRWLTLHGQDAGVDRPMEALRAYVRSGSVSDGEHARHAMIQRQQLLAAEASEAYRILAEYADKSARLPRLDELMGILIQRHPEARKLVAARLSANPTEVFQELYHIGDESLKALLPVVLDSSLWSPDGKSMASAQRDVFRLSIATLIEAGVERPERAMRAVTHLLAVQPESIAELLDGDVADIVLSDLDIRLDVSLRRQATLATSKMLEVTGEKGEHFFVTFVKEGVAKQDCDDLIVAFSAAAAVFPILPVAAARLFMTDGFVQQLVPNLERNSDDAAHGKRNSHTLEQAALELLSAACVDKSCRDAINQHCAHWLTGLSQERDGVHKALAALILAKTSGSSIEDVISKLRELVIARNSEGEQAIEGLAYTSLQPKVKEYIASDGPLLRSIVEALEDRPAALFGCLNIFANLTAYRPTLSDEQKKMAQLKAYANSAEPPQLDPLDDDKHTTARCRNLLDCGAVPALGACCSNKQQPGISPTNVLLVARILRALAKEQKHRPGMAQQGAVKLLLQICDRTAKPSDQAINEAIAISQHAAHALARLLISVNPAHVFSAAFPATSAVSALTPLLNPGPAAEASNEPRDLLPTFEAVLALTNLASMEKPQARDLLLRDTTFEAIENLLFSTHTLVQRATVELVCNLMAAPACVAMFADGSQDSKRRLRILIALTDVEDLATRRAAGGALAALTEWDVAVTAVLDAEKGVQAVLEMCTDSSEEVVHRGLVCLANVVGAPDKVGERAVETIKGQHTALHGVRARIKQIKNEDVVALAQDTLAKLG
ncbi:SWI5-dependent HO expression protein 4 [Teratosphaeriaceae sp. CCFEE 6253]|nr:SWI5-dependent HO expression protein 4 [Teratosphaeriaceae sp. CCFEE 6253]